MTYSVRKKLLTLAFLFTIMMVGVLATPSVFANQTNTLNLHCTSNKCELTPPDSPLFTVSNAVPATTFQTILTAKNSRKDACALSMQLDPLSQPQSLPLNHIFIAAISADGTRYLGSVVGQAAQNAVSVADLQVKPMLFGYLKPKETKDFIWYATIDPTLENQYQGSETTFDLTFQTMCDDPASILPTPTPTPAPTPTPQKKHADDGQTNRTPTVLGAQTTSKECSPAITESLTVVWLQETKAHVVWTSATGTTTIVFQDQLTGATFRHRGVTTNPHVIPQLDPTHTYTFWLETDAVCQDQVVSPVTTLATRQLNQQSKNPIDRVFTQHDMELQTPSQVLGAATDTEEPTYNQELEQATSGNSEQAHSAIVGIGSLVVLAGIYIRRFIKKNKRTY